MIDNQMTPDQRVEEAAYVARLSAFAAIATAIRKAENAAFERAAAIALDYDEDHENRAVMLNTAGEIFRRIKALNINDEGRN